MRDRERESSILNIKWREWRQQQSGVSISGKLITVASLVDYPAGGRQHSNMG